MDYKTVLARNVWALMQRNEALNSPVKLASHCRMMGVDVSDGAVEYLIKPTEGPPPKVAAVAAIASVFKVPLLALVSPDFDPERRPTEHGIPADMRCGM